MKKLLLILILITAFDTMAQQLIIEEKVKFLALGDSYTIGESVPQNARWPVQLIDALRKKGLQCADAKIIATTGWRTDNLKSAIDKANLSNEYSLVALLIGVNNQYQGLTAESYAPEFEELLNKAIMLAGNDKSHVFVVSIPDYGYTPFGKSNQISISKGIDAFNNVNRSISEKIGVRYFNITDISRRGLNEPDLVAGDGLHPSGKQYTEWTQLILKGASIKTSDQGEVTGVEDEQYGLNIYPNPFQNNLTIENLLYFEQPVNIKIIDIKGVVAYHGQFLQRDKVELDTSAFISGMYHYQIEQQNGNIITGKIIKE